MPSSRRWGPLLQGAPKSSVSRETAVPALNAPSADLIHRFIAIVGEAHAVTAGVDQEPYLKEWRDKYTGRTPVVLRPGTTEEVSSILKLANAHRIGIVPQSGNTGLVGGQIPSMSGTEILLSLTRLRAVRDVDPAGGTFIAEAGVTLAEAQATAEKVGRFFPLSLASQGSCMIGGVLSTNAGGTAVLAYGNARQLCLGLEVVLADGRVWNGLRRLKKDNSGYDLRDLMIGAEGTLGIITAATLKLLPRPVEQATAIVSFTDLGKALATLRLAEETAGSSLTAFEFWGREVMDFSLKYCDGTRDPLAARYPWYGLIEISSTQGGGRASEQLEAILVNATEAASISDAAIAQSLAQAHNFWQMRESFSSSQKPAGGSIKHDVSVPIARIGEFIDKAAAIIETICPGARPVPFGHFGDGNVHYNVSQPEGMDKTAFLALWEPITRAIHELVASLEGSFSAEHGVGQMKRADMAAFKSPVELDLMRSIKTALDPNGILNPGKVL